LFTFSYSYQMIPTGSVVLQAASSAALNSEGRRQAGELGLALLLSAAIGLEREIRQRTPGCGRRPGAPNYCD
jgi:hypothetical protein